MKAIVTETGIKFESKTRIEWKQPDCEESYPIEVSMININFLEMSKEDVTKMLEDIVNTIKRSREES